MDWKPPQGKFGEFTHEDGWRIKVWVPDKKRMVPRVNAPGWSFGMWFFVCDSKLLHQKGISWIYKHNCKS